MDAAEYKHVVLGLIFLNYLSDAFEEKHTELRAAFAPRTAATLPAGCWRLGRS
jgi:type I restriction-modification system DNA methylase subunit